VSCDDVVAMPLDDVAIVVVCGSITSSVVRVASNVAHIDACTSLDCPRCVTTSVALRCASLHTSMLSLRDIDSFTRTPASTTRNRTPLVVGTGTGSMLSARVDCRRRLKNPPCADRDVHDTSYVITHRE
jgi:hypothetical protein